MKPETTSEIELLRSQVVMQRYGNLENALARLSPISIQKAIYSYSIKSNRQAYLTDSITLATFAKAYSKDSCIALIELWLFELNDFVGVNGKMNSSQINQLAQLVYSEAYSLNFAEFGLFFKRVKMGLYGEFFGVVDPMKIMTFLEQFLIDRSKSIEDYNKELDQDKKRLDFQSCLNMKLTEDQQTEISDIHKNFIKTMKR